MIINELKLEMSININIKDCIDPEIVIKKMVIKLD